MTQSYVPGDVEFGGLELEGKDYSDKFVSMMFKEHLFSPFVKGSIEINQYEGAMGNFDGTKSNALSFKTPDGMKRDYSSLMVNSVKPLRIDDAQRSRNFMVDLISKHAATNNFTPNFQKSFKNIQVSSMIKTVLQEGLGLNIPLNIDDTKGLQGSDYQPIILTQKSPLKHIEDLRRMAISNENYDGFLAFSGIGGSGGEEMNFKSIFSMLKSSPVARFTNYSKYEMNSQLDSPTMHNVMEMFSTTTQTMMDKYSFGRGTTKLDLNKAKIEVPSLEFGKSRQETGSGTSLNPGKLSGFVGEAFNGMPGTGNMYLEDSRRPDTRRAETAPYTQSLFADITQNFFTIKVPGNSNLKIGDIVEYEMRENTEGFLNKDTQQYGKHMIVGMTNYIGPIGDRPRYVTYLDLVNIQTYNGKIS